MQEIICILDKSGSMQSVAEDARGGFNAFLEDQKKIGDANLTIVMFDDKWSIDYEGKIFDAIKLHKWPSGGMTALYDAIGKTINHVSKRFSKETPEKVILAILTDGHENNSKEFNQTSVANLIKEHKEKYGWDVIFLAADQDAWGVAQALNISQDSTFNYDSKNTKRGFAVYSAAVAKSRTR